MKKRYILPLLSAGIIYFGYSDADAKPKPEVPKSATTESVTNTTEQTKPNTLENKVNETEQNNTDATETKFVGNKANDVELNNIKTELYQAFVDSKECKRVYWAAFSKNKADKNVLVCDDVSDGKYTRKYSIPLSELCGVRLKENYHWYVLEWMGGDDVILETTYGNVSSMRFWDKPAEKIYSRLNEYIQKNIPNMEVGKCLK